MASSKKAKAPKQYTPTEITVTVERVAQPRQYHSIRVALSEKYAVGPGEDPAEVRKEAYRKMSKFVEVASERELSKYGEQE